MKKEKIKYINSTYSIPEKTLLKLDEYQKKTMVPKSPLITKLINDFLLKWEENEKKAML